MWVRKGGLPCRSKGRREKEEQRKRNRERSKGAGLSVWCSQENELRGRLLVQQNQIREEEFWVEYVYG